MSIWLLTTTTYGTWLPGDARGSITRVRDSRPEDSQSFARQLHNRPGEPCEPPIPRLQAAALREMKGEPIRLSSQHAGVVLAQLRETCAYRNWRLMAVAVMWNHIHLVVDLNDDRADKGLADLKAYASRSLNRNFRKPASHTWWTTKGSTRLLKDEQALAAAIHYVLHRQPNPLVVWPTEAAQ